MTKFKVGDRVYYDWRGYGKIYAKVVNLVGDQKITVEWESNPKYLVGSSTHYSYLFILDQRKKLKVI